MDIVKTIVFDKLGYGFKVSYPKNITYESFVSAYSELGKGVDCKKEFNRLKKEGLIIKDGSNSSTGKQDENPKSSGDRKKGSAKTPVGDN